MILMRRRILEYLAYLEQVDYDRLEGDEKERFRREMLVQIGFFAHERLVHLIVTVTFGILTMLSVMAANAFEGIGFLLLTVLLLVLLIPYVRHYYLLENGVQKMYQYYDKLACDAKKRKEMKK